MPAPRVLLGLLLTGTLITGGVMFHTELSTWVEQRPLLFPVFVFLAQLLFIPRITMLVISGLLFPPILAAGLTLLGDTTAAVVVWAWSRWSFSHATDGLFAGRPRWRRVRDALCGRSPVVALTVLRILPFSHFSTISLVSGALRLPLPAYVTGTVLGCIPTALFYAFAADWSLRTGSFLPALGLGLAAFSLVAWFSVRTLRDECPENSG
ncbi:MAG: hypothetical protein CVU59_07850 [Deltaproteobacteria bacterium HGW-Deltaproteobacteria-17]|nr:MAG: hypothetical protein CVU59_07850 [Deltaproteobacteria bacterium HGW-Deltaproteobacteria-17]